MGSEILEEFICAFSEDKHFIIDPIPLIKCGHLACKNCLLKEKSNSIKCKKCGVVSDFIVNDAEVSKALKQTMIYFFPSIFDDLEKKTNSKLNYIRGY
jgi:hypothetical protein